MWDDLKAKLKSKKVAILGIGNLLRNDDAAGAVLAERLKGRVPFVVLNGGVSPENFLEKIVRAKPEVVLLLDACDFGARAGEIKIISPQAIQNPPLFFTHNASISLSINYLQNSAAIDIIMLIIQPKDTGFGDKLSPEVEKGLKKIENWFDEI